MAYAYFRNITIHDAGVPSTQSDFPVLLSFSDPSFKTISNGGRLWSSQGYDLAFFSDLSPVTPLDFELEYYDGSTGEVIAWVRVPTLSGSGDTVLYLGYGDADVTTFQGNVAGTWNSGFKGVWHFPNGSTVSLADSTANANNASNTNVTADAGRIDGAADFNGTSSVGTLSNNSSLRPTSYTLSGWVKIPSQSAPRVIFSSFNQNGGIVEGLSWGHMVAGHAPSQHKLVIVQGKGGGGTTWAAWASSTNIDTDAWVYVATTWDGTNLRMYVNSGVDQANLLTSSSGIGNPAYNATNYVRIGAETSTASGGADTKLWPGLIDELRLSNVARSSDWIQTEYNNQSDPAAFALLGPESSNPDIAFDETSAIGILSAPLGYTLGYPAPSSDGQDIRNPLTAVDLAYEGSGQINLSGTGVTWIKMATTHMFQGDIPGDFWMRFATTGGGDPAFYVYANEADANNDANRTAECVMANGVPGVYPFVDSGDGLTVWGWLYTRGGISAGSSQAFPMGRANNLFGVPTPKWSAGAEVRVFFQFYISGYTHAPTTNFHLQLERFSNPGSPIPLGSFSFSNRSHSPEGGLVIGNLILKCSEVYDVTEGGAADLGFRTYLEMRPGSENLSQLIDLQPQRQEAAPTLGNEWHFLSLTQEADDGGGSPLTFYLYDTHIEYIPAP